MSAGPRWAASSAFFRAVLIADELSARSSTAGLQVVHAPLTHCSPAPHTLPQLPQLFGSVLVLVSHPFDSLLPSQSA